MAEAASSGADAASDPLILHIIVVGFHHTRGSEVEFCYPKLKYGEVDDKPVVPPEWQNVTALALPDGAHLAEEDAVYFMLPDLDHTTKQLAAVACYRQIEAAELEEKSGDVKRRIVQKSVCVLSRQPLFGLIQHHLQLATHAYFREKNFTKTQILVEVYNHLNHTLHPSPSSSLTLSPQACISAKKLVLRFGRKALVLFKLMLLERKVLFFSHPVQQLCETVVALLSLFPGVLENSLTNIHPAAPPVSSSVDEKPEGLDLSSTSDGFGFPLRFCRADTPVLPYMSLQEMENFKGEELRGCVAGATNALFTHLPNLVDVKVDTDSGSVEIVDPALRGHLTLTIADERFADQVLSAVQEDDQSSTSGTNWYGGDDWVRQQFRQYLVSLLVCSRSKDTKLMADFGSNFSRTWKETYNYRHWRLCAHPAVTDIEPKHPCKGQLQLADLRDHVTSGQIRQSFSNSKVRLGEALNPLGQKLGAAATSTRTELGGAISSASSTVGGWFSSWRSKNPDAVTSSPSVSTRKGRAKNSDSSGRLSFTDTATADDEDEDDFELMTHGKSRFFSLPPGSPPPELAS